MLVVKIEELTRVIEDLIHVIRTTGKNESSKQKTIDDLHAQAQAAEVIKPAPVVEAAPVMLAGPTFEPVVEAAPVANCPITDGKSLIDYVMTVYKELGPEKGAKIQGVLTEMGLQNVNELRPTEYAAFYAKVEALK